MKRQLKVVAAAALFIFVAAACESDGTSQQVGDNAISATQHIDTSSGDAVPGSQVFGLIGDGTIQASHSATDTNATSGEVNAANRLTITTGPQALAVDGIFGLGTSVASSSQLGANEVAADQIVVAASGDATSGSQVVGGVDGDPTFQLTSTASATDASSGSVDSIVNAGDIAAGPVTVAVGGFLLGGPGTANAQQIGSNFADLAQAARAQTGDAVAGSQVSGAVGGTPVAQYSNSADSIGATSGDVELVSNDSEIRTGPLAVGLGGPLLGSDGTAASEQVGDNLASSTQVANAQTGDAVSGSQISGTVDGSPELQGTNYASNADATSGSVLESTNEANLFVGPAATGAGAILFGPAGYAAVSQIGDNVAEANQFSDASTGDAVSGSQINGTVGGSPTIQGANSADDVAATSGDATSYNFSDIQVGPSIIISGDNANASQIGDNNVALDQWLSAATGDAISGSQIVGTVDSNSTNQESNQATGSTAVSGSSDVSNSAGIGLGPSNTATQTSGQHQQIGSNTASARQRAASNSGDSVSGSQVKGNVSGDGNGQDSNGSGNSTATTGDSSGSNTMNFGK